MAHRRTTTMTLTNETPKKDTPVQPSLESLMAGYLRRQAEAQAQGLAAPDLGGEVVPYDAGPVQPVDARAAWDEALVAARLVCPAGVKAPKAPPHWAQVVAQHEPVMAVALGVANFPQLVRNLQPVMQKANLAELRPAGGRPTNVPALADQADDALAKGDYARALLTAGSLRLAKQFDQAATVLEALESSAPAEWAAAVTNEKAVLAWQSGRPDEARALWQSLPDSAASLFNRGMAALFCGEAAEARAPLEKALADLPEGSGWHHLARFYLTLAEMRG